MSASLIPKDRIPITHLLLFGWLPSPLKRLAYRLLGYRIGKGVKFSFGGVVVGKHVELGDHVEIGLLAVVQGRNITIGRHSSVGTMSYVSCETIVIGEDAKSAEQVYFGGPHGHDSRRDRPAGRRAGSQHHDRPSFQRRHDELCVVRNDRHRRGREERRAGIFRRPARARLTSRSACWPSCRVATSRSAVIPASAR